MIYQLVPGPWLVGCVNEQCATLAQLVENQLLPNSAAPGVQVVVLARVIVDQDQVTLTARGIMLLVNKLQSQDDKVLVLACSLLSSLAHTRAGIPDAMITSGAIDLLVNHLNSANDQVPPHSVFVVQWCTTDLKHFFFDIWLNGNHVVELMGVNVFRCKRK